MTVSTFSTQNEANRSGAPAYSGGDDGVPRARPLEPQVSSPIDTLPEDVLQLILHRFMMPPATPKEYVRNVRNFGLVSRHWANMVNRYIGDKDVSPMYVRARLAAMHSTWNELSAQIVAFAKEASASASKQMQYRPPTKLIALFEKHSVVRILLQDLLGESPRPAQTFLQWLPYLKVRTLHVEGSGDAGAGKKLQFAAALLERLATKSSGRADIKLDIELTGSGKGFGDSRFRDTMERLAERFFILLKVVTVTRLCLDNFDMDAFNRHCPAMPRLEQLVLWNSEIDQLQISLLVRQLKNFPSLTLLDVRGHALTPDIVIQLKNRMATNHPRIRLSTE